MKGICLCGGKGSRLGSLTKVTNKHLLPIYDKPMVFYPIQTLVQAGITDIMVVTGGNFAGHFLGVLKNGEDVGVKNLHYAYQQGEGGIADALRLAEDFADGDDVAVILGDNIFDMDISDEVKWFEKGARIFLKHVPDPERFGVAEFYKDSTVIKSIVEKPAQPPSSMAVTGLYMYDWRVFEYIRDLKPSSRGELEITDINNKYLSNQELGYSIVKGMWQDCGLPDSLYKASKYWYDKKHDNT